jgi:phospholipid-binding lipoprotein MlaA
VFNPAGAIGIERTREDFGQTLGAWGVPAGPYLVMPFLGSTSPRDLVGFGVSRAMDPLNYAEFDGDVETRIGTGILAGLSGRERAIETIDDVRATQVDPYTTLRRFYVRNRASEVGNQAPQSEDTPKVPDYELDF